jgi:hypothetical protein
LPARRSLGAGGRIKKNRSKAVRANRWLELSIRLYQRNPRNLRFNDLFFSGKNALTRPGGGGNIAARQVV